MSRRRLEVAPLAGDPMEGHELGAERACLVGLQVALAGDHVAVVAAGVDVGVVGEGHVRPRGVPAAEAVGDPVVGHAPHVGHHRRVPEVLVQQVPRREGHRDLVAAEAARVVLGLPHLVLEHVRHAVRARGELLPEAPDQAHHAVEGSGRVVVGPRQDHPVGARSGSRGTAGACPARRDRPARRRRCRSWPRPRRGRVRVRGPRARRAGRPWRRRTACGVPPIVRFVAR